MSGDPAEIAARAVAEAMASILRAFLGKAPEVDEEEQRERLKAAAQQHAGPLPQNRRKFAPRASSAIRLGGSEDPHG